MSTISQPEKRAAGNIDHSAVELSQRGVHKLGEQWYQRWPLTSRERSQSDQPVVAAGVSKEWRVRSGVAAQRAWRALSLLLLWEKDKNNKAVFSSVVPRPEREAKHRVLLHAFAGLAVPMICRLP